MALRTVARQLPDDGWQVPVRMLEDSGPRFPAAELLTRRLVEVELHHCDLGAGYGPAAWPAAFAAMELGEPMRTWRQDRLGYPEPEPAQARPGRPRRGAWPSAAGELARNKVTVRALPRSGSASGTRYR